ncbi:MAG: hypothetical protein WKG07_42770 [Hymenobacter sp.]
MAAALLNTPEKAEAGAKRHPLQRVGRPADLADMAAFLLSDQATFHHRSGAGRGWRHGQAKVALSIKKASWSC